MTNSVAIKLEVNGVTIERAECDDARHAGAVFRSRINDWTGKALDGELCEAVEIELAREGLSPVTVTVQVG